MSFSYDTNNLRDMLDKRESIFKALRRYRADMARAPNYEDYQFVRQLFRDAESRSQMLTRDIKKLYAKGVSYKLPGPKRLGRDRRLADPIGFLVSKPRVAWPSEIV